MKQDLSGSSISVPIPTELYVALLGSLHARGDRKDPVATIVTFIRKQLSETTTVIPPRVAGSNSHEEWSDDWISFQAPPCPDRTAKTVSFLKNRRIKQENNPEWCIGCGCPSPDIID